MECIGRKAIVGRSEVAAFNRAWPCSKLSSERRYWFEFDANGDLIDTDVPEHSDGEEASAMADDCRDYVMNGNFAAWMNQLD